MQKLLSLDPAPIEKLVGVLKTLVEASIERADINAFAVAVRASTKVGNRLLLPHHLPLQRGNGLLGALELSLEPRFAHFALVQQALRSLKLAGTGCGADQKKRQSHKK